MKKTLTTLILLFLVNVVPGQSKEDDPLALSSFLPPISQLNFNGTFQRYQFQHAPVYNSFGISGEAVFGKHLGIEVGLSGGKGNFQAGLGMIVLPFFLVASTKYNENPDDLGKYLIKSLLVVLFFDHVNYHIKLSEHFQLIPYVSLLSYRYMRGNEMNPEYYSDYKFSGASGSAGMKAGFFQKKWLLNAYCEYSLLYNKEHLSGLQAGINLGLIIPD